MIEIYGVKTCVYLYHKSFPYSINESQCEFKRASNGNIYRQYVAAINSTIIKIFFILLVAIYNHFIAIYFDYIAV